MSVNNNLAITAYENIGKPRRMNPGKIIGDNVIKFRKEAGLSANALAKELGVRVNTVQKIEDGTTQKSRFIPDIARILNRKIWEIDPSQSVENEPNENFRVPANTLVGGNDLPVYASVDAGDGVVLVSSEPVQTVRRPDPLATVRGGYGVIVVGDSMTPLVRPGDTVLVHPHQPPQIDDICLFIAEKDGEFRATIKEYRGQTKDHWKVRRYQPSEKDYTLPKRDWTRCERVVGIYKRR